MIKGVDLIGTWVTDPTDIAGTEEYGRASIEFRRDGGLIYTAHSAGKDEMSILSYKLTEDGLVTNQLSSPGKEKSVLEIDTLGRLMIRFGGATSRYVRANRLSPTSAFGFGVYQETQECPSVQLR